MQNTNSRIRHAFLAFPALAAALLTAAAASAQPAPEISFDGLMDDWADGIEAVATDRWVYLRHDTEEPASIQNGPVMTVLQIDLDHDAATGLAVGGGTLGVDLEITMTTLDRRDPTRLGGGIEINAYGSGGRHEVLTHPRIGFSCLPTHASTSFEVRVARDMQGPPWFEEIAHATDRLRYRFIHRDAQYMDTWAGDARSVALPGMTEGRELFDVAIPAKDDSALRVVSWNVLWGTPSKNPDGFARVLRALDPDVILFQEWDHGYWTDKPKMPQREFTGWLDKHLGGGPWSVATGNERGVVVASRSQISPFLPERIDVSADRHRGLARDRVVRCASGRVATPLGEVGAVSVHFKSQGGLDTREDRIRIAEATEVHGAIRTALSAGTPDFLVIAGDWNLVGGRGPLEHAVEGVDLDGSDLRVLQPRRLGMNDFVTWRDQRSAFAPGRLDYALVSDAGVEVVRSFVLDTTVLTDSSLSASRLLRKDTDGSDHLPMVLDLRRVDQD